jgi:HSP20 family protein
MRRQLTSYRQDPMFDFMSEVQRAMDDFWQSPRTGSGREAEPTQSFLPAVDLHETPEFYLVSLDVPGVSQKDIKIDVQQGRLTISGERRRTDKEDSALFKRFERSYGRFERSFQLPQDVSQEKIQARFENGVLEVMVPKAEVAKPRSIAIESSDKGGLFSGLLGRKTVDVKTDDKKNENH